MANTYMKTVCTSRVKRKIQLHTPSLGNRKPGCLSHHWQEYKHETALEHWLFWQLPTIKNIPTYSAVQQSLLWVFTRGREGRLLTKRAGV